MLTGWRKQLARPTRRDKLLSREIARLSRQLARAKAIIDIQKKPCTLLELSTAEEQELKDLWRGSRPCSMRVAIKAPCARCTGCWAAKGLSGEHQHRPVSMQTRLTYCAARSNRTLRPHQSCAIESTKVVALCTLTGSKHCGSGSWQASTRRRRLRNRNPRCNCQGSTRVMRPFGTKLVSARKVLLPPVSLIIVSPSSMQT